MTVLKEGFIRMKKFALGHSAIMMITKQSSYAKRSDEFGEYGYIISKEGVLRKGLFSMSISECEIKKETFKVDYQLDIVKQFIEQLKSKDLIQFKLIPDPYITLI